MIRSGHYLKALVILLVAGCAGHSLPENNRFSLIDGQASIELPSGLKRVKSRQYAAPGQLSDDSRRILFLDDVGAGGMIVSYRGKTDGGFSASQVSPLMRSMAGKKPGMKVLKSEKRLIDGAQAGYAVFEAPSSKDSSTLYVQHLILVDLPDGLLNLLLTCASDQAGVCEGYAVQIFESLSITSE